MKLSMSPKNADLDQLEYTFNVNFTEKMISAQSLRLEDPSDKIVEYQIG